MFPLRGEQLKRLLAVASLLPLQPQCVKSLAAPRQPLSAPGYAKEQNRGRTFVNPRPGDKVLLYGRFPGWSAQRLYQSRKRPPRFQTDDRGVLARHHTSQPALSGCAVALVAGGAHLWNCVEVAARALTRRSQLLGASLPPEFPLSTSRVPTVHR